MAYTAVTDQNFQSEVLDHQGKVLVDFWAPWCGPCQMLGPIIEEIGMEQPANVKVVKVNVDENNAIASKLGVTAIPTVVVFDNGKVKETIVGFHQKQDYLTALNA
ncbi:MAG TPA: thioredoxin [Patescibacteria group bacterium]